MRENTLDDGISRLEAISAEFDYDKAQQYVLLAKKFFRGVREFVRDTPMFEVTRELRIDLPEEVRERLDTVLAAKPDYAPTTQKVCLWYLLELHSMDLGMKPASRSVYEPLLQMLELGGDFYEHHGALCIRDVAMLPFANAKS